MSGGYLNPVNQLGEQVRALVEELYGELDRVPYYTLLGISRHARGDAVRNAFYRRAEMLHPDRFYSLDDAALRTKIYEVYKRIAEGYRVLDDPASRTLYDEGLAKGQVRLKREERAGVNLKQPDEGVTNLQAKRFFRLGLDCRRAGDLRGARLNFGLALNMEPQNPVIQAQLAEVDAQLKGGR
jgi:DnaJ-class molecular chaperone